MKPVYALLFVLSVWIAACAPNSTSSSVLPVMKTDAQLSSVTSKGCGETPAATYTNSTSLSHVVEMATGKLPSSTNVCFAIFNVTHGNRTNMLYVKNGWGLLNLPVDVFEPWAEDVYVVGDPISVAKYAVVDSDTVVVDGGVVGTTDWSTVKGGVYVNEIRFESDRTVFVSNERVWSATCNGQTFDNSQLQQALACGRGE